MIPPIWETKDAGWVKALLTVCKYWEYPYGGIDNIDAMVAGDVYTFYQGEGGLTGYALEWRSPRVYRMMTFLPVGTDEAWIAKTYAELVKQAKAKGATKLIAYGSWAEMAPSEVLRLFKMKTTKDVLHFKGIPLVVYQRVL